MAKKTTVRDDIDQAIRDKEGERSVFEKVMDYVAPTATGVAGFYLAKKAGGKIAGRQAEKYIKARKSGPLKKSDPLTAEDEAFLRKMAKYDVPIGYGLHGGLAGLALGDAAVGNPERRLAAKRRK